jgi:transglutaminase-like putative cysteine protease
VYGNLCQRLTALPGRFTIRTSSDAMTSDRVDVAPGAPFTEIRHLPDPVLTWLTPSRYCESDRFGELAGEIVRGERPGYDQVRSIVDWIEKSVRYRPGSSNVPVSAMETKQRGQGVCRDLAHMGISLCRSLGIPARMVVGYLHGLEPMDFHAWFEAWVGGRWYTFDPTSREPRGGRIAVGYGKDAADVAVFTQFGPALFPTSMSVGVGKLNRPPE